MDTDEEIIRRMEASHGGLKKAIEWAGLHAASHIGVPGERHHVDHWLRVKARGREMLRCLMKTDTQKKRP